MDRKKLEDYKMNQAYRESLVRAFKLRRESVNRLVASYEGERVQNSKKIEDGEAEQLVKILDDMTAEIRYFQQNTEELKKLTENLNKITNPKHRQVLSMRYLEGMPLEKIATEMKYDYRHICRLHGNALAEWDKL